jgi:hypothetical protein
VCECISHSIRKNHGHGGAGESNGISAQLFQAINDLHKIREFSLRMHLRKWRGVGGTRASERATLRMGIYFLLTLPCERAISYRDSQQCQILQRSLRCASLRLGSVPQEPHPLPHPSLPFTLLPSPALPFSYDRLHAHAQPRSK